MSINPLMGYMYEHFKLASTWKYLFPNTVRGALSQINPIRIGIPSWIDDHLEESGEDEQNLAFFW